MSPKRVVGLTSKGINMQRRVFIKTLLAAGTLVLVPLRALAGLWNAPAFQATKLQEALAGMQIHQLTASSDIQVLALDKAENGAVVQIEVTSRIPNTESIAIFVEHNPTPLIANFVFSGSADSFVITRIKMAETSDVLAVIKVGNQYFSAQKRVEVLENGCG